MGGQSSTLLIYVLPMLLIWGGYAWLRARRTQRSQAVRTAAQAAGLNEPASLHPVIDPALCIGCGSCVDACPEKTVLGLIHGKAELVNPSSCIGHGACRAACPTHSITLVFGTARRGVDIPLLKPNFETNVPGVFIAGELGGMGLIRNAVTQGKQAIDAIRTLDGIGTGTGLDVVIVGAGPAGIAASLAAQQQHLRYVTLEQDSLGGTVAHYPRGKLVMTAPAQLPLAGAMPSGEVSKETLLDFWTKITRDHKLNIRHQERMEGLQAAGEGYIVETARERYATRAVLLTIGRRGTPRKLDVPGEELAKVVYRLVDPEQYRGQCVLVAGGGDSALEAACDIADQPGTTVTLTYRGDGFSRAKPKNRERIDQARATGRLKVYLESKVLEITSAEAVLEQNGTRQTIANDAVIVCAGGVLPTPFLKGIGIEVETKFGTA